MMIPVQEVCRRVLKEIVFQGCDRFVLTVKFSCLELLSLPYRYSANNLVSEVMNTSGYPVRLGQYLNSICGFRIKKLSRRTSPREDSLIVIARKVDSLSSRPELV